MTTTFPSFHIAVDGPDGTSFPSFPSSALEGGDPDKIQLAIIRNRCRISNKLFFTIDGKSRVADTTSLAYYMSLSPGGQAILTPPKPVLEVAPPADDDEDDGKDKTEAEKEKAKKAREKAEAKRQADAAKKLADAEAAIALKGVPTFTLKVTNGSTAPTTPLVPLPAANEALNKLLTGISTSTLKKGDLLTFADREMASLKASYAVNAGSGNHPEPVDLTETQWDKVFTNNRALHGWFYDFEKNILTKAKKRAFKLRGAAPVGKPPTEGENQNANKDLPPIPPFYIADDAYVGVTEIRNQFQKKLTNEGFNSLAVGGSIGGGPASIPGSVNASYEKEHAWSNQERTATDVSSLVATYNFPRVVVELDQDSLELTEECRRDILRISDRAGRDKFFRNYGSIFASQFTLGGFLHSTRNVTASERSTLDQVKDRTRIAAGISLQSPKASGSLNVAKVEERSSETATASLFQDVRLTWNARGGDTLLTSNPPAWANTVKNYQLWRLMDQQRLVKLEGLIQDIDIIAYRQLENPSGGQPPVIIDDAKTKVLTDPAVNSRARINLVDAFMSSSSNALAIKTQNLYEDGHYESAANGATVNEVLAKFFPKEKDLLIKIGARWGELEIDMKVGFGLYVASLGQIQVV